MDYRKMSELAKDPVAVRRVANSLLVSLEGRLKENATRFLTELLAYDGSKQLSTRDKEFLYSLMSQGDKRTQMFGGYRAFGLLSELWSLHLDLDESAEKFVEEMLKLGPDVALTNGQWRYVLHLCRDHDIIHHWVAA